jgi:hypothetical protein
MLQQFALCRYDLIGNSGFDVFGFDACKDQAALIGSVVKIAGFVPIDLQGLGCMILDRQPKTDKVRIVLFERLDAGGEERIGDALSRRPAGVDELFFWSTAAPYQPQGHHEQ